MVNEYVIASTGAFRFDTAALIDAVLERWPDSRTWLPEGQVGNEIELVVYVPTSDPRSTEVAFCRAGDCVLIETVDDAQTTEVIRLIISRSALPNDGSVVLTDWTDGDLPLDPEVTASSLLALRGR